MGIRRSSRAMSSRAMAGRHVVIAIVLFASALVGTLFIVRDSYRRSRAATQPTTTTAPTSAPATTRVAALPAPPTDYMGLVLLHDPDFPTTQPLIIPVDDLADAARLIFTEPIYLDPLGQL